MTTREKMRRERQRKRRIRFGFFLIALTAVTIFLGAKIGEFIRKADFGDKNSIGASMEVKEGEEADDKDDNKNGEEVFYEGEALNVIERNGITKVYKEKDLSSEVIYELNDHDKVELLETLPFGWFKVKLQDGQTGFADARYIRSKSIPPFEYNENSSEWVLMFTEEDQTLKIYKNGKIEKTSLGSSGEWDNFTPKGVFQIEKDRRGDWAYIPRFEQGIKYWVGFKDSYLFHSLPFDENKKLIQEEAEKLGTPASHGCIRLPVEIAKYIYDNVPEGSIVIIK
ncbi:MAG: hypothetical protein E7205_05455 [Tissierellaceae bacterium]|jgi:hypothetical protein|nr:hypothetical protein [Tissierellaceae bacterium]